MHISRGLPGLYTAVQMHLHWGGLDLETSGSEHTIDGMRYFAEVLVSRAGGRLQGWAGSGERGSCNPQSLQGAMQRQGGEMELP